MPASEQQLWLCLEEALLLHVLLPNHVFIKFQWHSWRLSCLAGLHLGCAASAEMLHPAALTDLEDGGIII